MTKNAKKTRKAPAAKSSLKFSKVPVDQKLLKSAKIVQRTIFHVTCGDDTWESSQKELSAMSEMFSAALLESGINMPVVATRQGVNVEIIKT